MFERVLIANRGEIAIRIADAASALGIDSVAVFSDADRWSLHTTCATDAALLDGTDAISPYLDVAAIIAAAKAHNCDCLHPGYGFLSESPELAQACADVGIVFIGPTSRVLQLFGDKIAARQQAQTLDLTIIPGSESAVESVAQAQEIAEQIGYPVMLKAVAGGGGRGMRRVDDATTLESAFRRCQSEALAAFGTDGVFIEKLIENPRHIEVQILADNKGGCIHLYERDCSVQYKNQKLLEIAPAAALGGDVKNRLYDEAVRLAQGIGYSNAGTVEFLFDPASGNHYFIECNPRIQVEHTITEQITGVDLVQAQFKIAAGASLADLGLSSQSEIASPEGYAVQARVNIRGAGRITAYKEPSGSGVRVDAYGYSGFEAQSHFDSLLAKVIGSHRESLAQALHQTRRALERFHIAGVATNIASLVALLEHPDVASGDARTTLLENNPHLVQTEGGSSNPVFQLLERHSNSAGAGAPQTTLPGVALQSDHEPLVCPLQGVFISSAIEVGSEVKYGDALMIVGAMKMETEIRAPCSGTVTDLLALRPGDAVAVGQALATIKPAAGQRATETKVEAPWSDVLADVETLQSLGQERFAPGSQDPGVLRQRERGKLTCRERIDLLLDDGSFYEVGSIAGFASYDEEGRINAFTPANSVGGWGTIGARKIIVCADDFTSRGGHSDGAIGAKSTYLDQLAIELCIPSVRLLDGSSGGGSVAAMIPEQKKSGENNSRESQGAIKAGRPRVVGGGGSYLPGHLGSSMYTEQLGIVPVVNLLLGSVVGLGAGKAVLGHFSVMVRDISQLFVAGPPVVSHAMGYDVTKEELGGWQIHCRNGAVDNLAESETEAIAMAQRFLSYLPQSVYGIPPHMPVSSGDSPDRKEAELRYLIPRNRTTTFDIRRIISLVADHDSFFEIGPMWGSDQVTGLIRVNGYPMGVIASDSRHPNGGALTADGCDKLTRHLDLCDLFHLPVLNLVDSPGFAVGIEHEQAATIRAGGRWMVAFAQTRVPVFTIVLRRCFGLAGNNYATPRSRPSMRIAWPSADVGGIPPEGGIEATYKRQLAEAEDPQALRAEIMSRIEAARGPVGPLTKFQMEEMIDPAETRGYLARWVELAYDIISRPGNLQPRAIGFRP